MKKSITTLLLFIFLHYIISAQFQNWDFEIGGNNGVYDTLENWSTTNPMTSPIGQVSFIINNASYSGLQAASMNTVNLGIAGLPYPGAIVNGNYGFSSLTGYDDYIKGGEPVSYPLGGSQISGISGYWYYSSLTQNDSAVAKVLLKTWNISTNSVDTVALGELKAPSTTSYVPFKIPLNYLNNNLPDSIVVAFFSTDPDTPLPGGKFKVDKLSLDYTTNINKLSTLKLETYPNPFEDYLWIKQNNNQSYQWKLYDIIGNIILEGRTQIEHQRLDMSMLSPGLYLLKAENSEGSFTKQIHKQ